MRRPPGCSPANSWCWYRRAGRGRDPPGPQSARAARRVARRGCTAWCRTGPGCSWADLAVRRRRYHLGPTTDRQPGRHARVSAPSRRLARRGAGAGRRRVFGGAVRGDLGRQVPRGVDLPALRGGRDRPRRAVAAGPGHPAPRRLAVLRPVLEPLARPASPDLGRSSCRCWPPWVPCRNRPPCRCCATLAGLHRPCRRLRRLLHERWRPFLAITGHDEEEPRYSVYHASLREFLAGQLAEDEREQLTDTEQHRLRRTGRRDPSGPRPDRRPLPHPMGRARQRSARAGRPGPSRRGRRLRAASPDHPPQRRRPPRASCTGCWPANGPSPPPDPAASPGRSTSGSPSTTRPGIWPAICGMSSWPGSWPGPPPARDRSWWYWPPASAWKPATP